MADENISSFDIRAFRGHFRIAASFFEGGVAAFEKLQKFSDRQAKKIEEVKNRALVLKITYWLNL